ncbi:MAG TPA: redoxin domain-containing protein, partial [Bacteroidetes bacterium]|nr:redoxin domain-containing protein [Bacteroidota bacterium]HEX05294.1 redoxin domain-containing protein [Bacteroidota bacterium]
TLPAEISGLPAGSVEVTIRPGLAYPPKTLTATVNPPEITDVNFTYTSTEIVATVTVTANEAIAIIVVDEQLQPDLNLGEAFSLPAGAHSISLYKEGYVTLSPSLYAQEYEGIAYTLDFALEEAEYGAEVGELFYDFTFDDDWGGQQTLGQYRGQVVLVSFWFSTCIPCLEEFPIIETIFQERAAGGFRVLAVNTGWNLDDQADFEEMRDELGLSFPLLFNGFSVDWVLNDLGVQNAPTNFMIRPDGVINDRRGQITYELLNEMIDAALDE